MASFDMLQPASIEAEVALLGAAMLEPAIIGDVRAVITSSEMFYRTQHQEIWDALVWLYTNGKDIDWVSVATRAQSQGSEVNQNNLITITETMASSWGWEQWAETVRNRYLRRATILLADELRKTANDPTMDVSEIVQKIQSEGMRINDSLQTGRVTNLSALDEVERMVDAMASENPQIPGFSTGHSIFDARSFGLAPGGLSLLAGQSSMGKTFFSFALMDEMTRAGTRAGMVQGEMGLVSLLMRQIVGARTMRVLISGADRGTIESAHRDAKHRIKEVRSTLRPDRFVVPKSMTIDTVNAAVVDLAVRGKCPVIFIDYIGMVRVPKVSNMAEQAHIVLDRLKRTAQQLNIHIVCLAQFTAEANRKRSMYEIDHFDAYGGTNVSAYIDNAFIIGRPKVHRGISDNYGRYCQMKQVLQPDLVDSLVMLHVTKDRLGEGDPYWFYYKSMNNGLWIEPIVQPSVIKVINGITNGARTSPDDQDQE